MIRILFKKKRAGLVALLLVVVTGFMTVGSLRVAPQVAHAAQPTMASAVTADNNNNDGTIDWITITFSEAVNIVDGSDLDGFSSLAVSNGCTIDMAEYAAVSTTTMDLALSGCTTQDSSITPTITYTAVANCATSGAICDVATSTQMANAANVVAADGAAPAPVSVTFYDATGNDGKLDLITVVFSENISAVLNGSADWAISSAANFAGLAEGTVVCNSGAAAANECDYNFTTTTVKTNVGDLTLTYTAGTSLTDGTNNTGSLSFTSASTPAFTDVAKPVVTSVQIETAASGVLYNRFELLYSEPVSISVDAGADVDVTPGGAIVASTATLGGMTVAKTLAGIMTWDGASDMTSNTATVSGVSQDGAGTNIIVLINYAATGRFSAGSTGPGAANYTPVADANDVFDVAGNSVNASQTAVVGTVNTAWDVTKPTLTSASFRDNTVTNGRIDEVMFEFSEDMLDASFTNSNGTLGTTGTTTGTFPTVTSENDTVVLFRRTTDDADIGTALSDAYFEYSGVTSLIRDHAGNLLDATVDGMLADAELTKIDGAAPVAVSVSPSGVTVNKTADLAITFSEAMNTGFVEGTEFTISPDPGSFSAAVWTVSDTVVTLSHSAQFLCGANTVSLSNSDVVDLAASPNELSSAGELTDGQWIFTVGCSSSGGGSVASTYSVDVTSALDGTNWTSEDVMNVTWTPGGTGSVDFANIAYSIDGGATYTSIVTNTSNNGSYSWTVPSVLTIQGMIRVELTDLSQVVATGLSTGSFNIQVGAGSIPTNVTAPSTGTTGISPVTGLLEDISVVNAGDYIKSPYFSTVYYVDSNHVRHPFMDSQTYFTWQNSFSAIKVVTDATLPTMVLGAPMLPKPGITLVKIQSDNRVYAVEASSDMFAPKLRWITSESLATSLYGENWADYVIDLDVTLFPRFKKGTDITSNSSIAVDKSFMKTRTTINQ